MRLFRVHSASSISCVYTGKTIYMLRIAYFAHFVLFYAAAASYRTLSPSLRVEVLFVVQLQNNPGTREKYEKVKGDVQAGALVVIAYDAIFMATACVVPIILHYKDNGVYIFFFAA